MDYKFETSTVVAAGSRTYKDAGFARLAEVTAERWFDENGVQEQGRVVAKDVEGNLWALETLKGQTEAKNANLLLCRGYTTGDCYLID